MITRCGGQGDLLAGSLATFLHWALNMSQPPASPLLAGDNHHDHDNDGGDDDGESFLHWALNMSQPPALPLLAGDYDDDGDDADHEN